MFETDKTVKIRNKKYPLLFNVVALKLVGERYGGIKELGEKLQADEGKAIDEYAWILALLIGQGIALRNFENGTSETAPGPEILAMLMMPRDLYEQQPVIVNVIKDAMNSSAADGEEESDEVLDEVLARKNGEGAGDQ
jgi:hypothetical protein